MIGLADRPAELPPHEGVRQIGRELHRRDRVNQLQREEKIGRHPIAMRLEKNLDTRIVRQPLPSQDVGDALQHPGGPNVRLQVDVGGVLDPELEGVLDRRLKLVDRGGVALDGPLETALAQESGDQLGLLVIVELDRSAVEARIRDSRNLLLERPVQPLPGQTLHGPHRLKEQQAQCSLLRRIFIHFRPLGQGPDLLSTMSIETNHG